MQRFARVAHFMANLFIIILGVVFCAFAVNFSVNSAPNLYANVFPKDIVYAIAALGAVHLATSIFGCCTGYRQSPLSIVGYALLVTASAIAHIAIAMAAQLHGTHAGADTTSLWRNGSQQARALIEQQFQCCGWSDTTADFSDAALPDSSACNPSTAQACMPLVVSFWEDTMSSTFAVLLGTLAIPCVALIASIFFWWNAPRGKTSTVTIAYDSDDKDTHDYENIHEMRPQHSTSTCDNDALLDEDRDYQQNNPKIAMVK
ncbi:hypothetical protein BASA50_009733 [Batrachochytrium salamandrivorans]|uniref:Tetraspanin n=1 Tax=Batrachochytrium salamandrivorans TaxID=1357716 RepID=A0ABQ8F0S1_9FUNG|nr:hypothetical protein BASA62_004660 [Batrachochytrium salamandrivorans]KAH6570984.1 hypothetical protein BASA60_007413 [Batrachochytrium salamandrivorans]KAH6590031.1 hypothetical protein BASA50_009733 [Batrachochytrium salamandrivorans]KAH6592311.1 hypothetical protein BASA61_004634 [Batrachochytrium salamandrivorans]KAH9252628.1 hypothetical protein BASA81_009408 [Batrachochytrium salamandrivorans]